MSLFEAISSLLTAEGVSLFSPLPLSACHITKEYLLSREGIPDGTVIVCAVPYLPPECGKPHNISAYCAVPDYHKFFDMLFESVCGELKRQYPEHRFVGFADKSPIDERHAAAASGIGVLGRNGMIITEKYSSYVFLGELITDAVIPCSPQEPKECIACGKCRTACPAERLGQCLSALTQKKGELTEAESEALVEYNTAWGCDICQWVCPYTEKALKNGTIFTDISYFLTDVIPSLDLGILNALTDEEFSGRAFSWRGRQTVERNLKILEKKQ